MSKRTRKVAFKEVDLADKRAREAEAEEEGEDYLEDDPERSELWVCNY